MKNLKLLAVLLAGFFLTIQTQAAPVQATVVSLKGTAEIKKAGSDTFVPLALDQTVPAGSTIKTGKDSTLVLSPMPSIAVTISQNTEVTLVELDFAKSGEVVAKRKAVLDLKEGRIYSDLQKLDPKTTDYQVKMPQGVAAARGTKYTVTIVGGVATVSVQEGTVTVTDVNGKTYTIKAGESMSFNVKGVEGEGLSGGVFTDPSALPSVLNPANISGEASPNK
jgi:hypothetical protein